LGLSVRIIERKKKRTVHDSRAVVVHPRVMELLEPIRDGAFVSEIEKSAFFLSGLFAYLPNRFGWIPDCRYHDTTSDGNDKGSKTNSKSDTVPVHLNLKTGVSWGDTEYPNLFFLPQFETERILEEALTAEGLKVDYGIALEDLTQENGVVTSQLRNASNDTTESVTSRWVLGADGGRSKTRELVGITLNRHRSDLYFVIADVVIKNVDPPLASHAPGKGGHVFPNGPMAFLPLPGENCYRVAGTAPPGIKSKDDVTMDENFFEGLMLERTGRKFQLELGPWQTIFEITHGASDSYRNGNVMLAGDASHVHSPIGGQGMNLGMQDANNLLWKLAWSKRILKASSSEEEYEQGKTVVDSILETFNSERNGLGKMLVEQVEGATQALAIRNPILKFLRDEFLRIMLPSKSVKTNFRKMGQLDQAYDPSGSSLMFPNASWMAHYICTPGQRIPNIRLEDGSHLHSHIDRVHHTWVILNYSDDELAAEASSPLKSLEATVVRVLAADEAYQVSVPVISKKAYEASQVLLVRPDTFVAGVGANAQVLLDELKAAGMNETALATM